jgi:23S rRNA (pseudouridine1915-N3)-methyltransferase
MPIVVVAHGKLKDRGLRALVDDYLARIRRYTRVDEVEVKSDSALERALPAGATVIALEVGGAALTSSELAQKLGHWMSQGKGTLAFVIGGAEGLPAALSSGAAFQLSLSSLTLPHRLARLILVEQIYRAFTILKREPYAREDG